MKKERKLPKDGRFALEKLKTSVNIGFRDLVNNPKVASLFSIVDVADLQASLVLTKNMKKNSRKT